jgi:hypothetical protein
MENCSGYEVACKLLPDRSLQLFSNPEPAAGNYLSILYGVSKVQEKTFGKSCHSQSL